MKQNGLDTYDSDAKKQSRKIIQEELFRRLKDPSNATVLYLPGPHDYQRKSLLNIGFRNENIFGVDLGANVQAVRDRGGYCIEGKLHEVIDNWPTHRGIDVILADLCCGLDQTVDDVMCAIGSRQDKPLVYLNLQRGRDSISNYARQTATEAYKTKHAEFEKHRGRLWVMWITLRLSHINADNFVQQFKRAGINTEDPSKEELSFMGEEMRKAGERLIESFQLKYWSYRNTKSSVVMDSTIFQWCAALSWFLRAKRESSKSTRHRIAATLATATRRRNERLAA